MSTLFIPKKLNVGYNKRSDTYTNKLAYIIYYDEKGVLRKEKSWNDWRNKSIPNEEFDNEPMEGFVLNKHAGGKSYGWNDRHSYIRVYDPRGFEIEIKVDNLLYILEHCDCTKGKGIEGKLIYAWEGTELVLLPIDSESYKEAKTFSDRLFSKTEITNKDLIVGYTYVNKYNQNLLYLGRFNVYENDNGGDYKGKKHLFKNLDRVGSNVKNDYYNYEIIDNVKGRLVSIKDDTIHYKLTDYLDEFKDSNWALPIDEIYKETILNKEEVKELLNKSASYFKTYTYFIKKDGMRYHYMITSFSVNNNLLSVYTKSECRDKPFSMTENISLDDFMKLHVVYTRTKEKK